MHNMQVPTCKNCRIRSVEDALKLFTAVQRGILKMVTRRLDADERLALRPGDIYAWEERGSHTEITGLGIERFTEGRRWSPSRVRDEFLFYYEKYSPPADAARQSSKAEKQPPRDWDPLVKQTYSVFVTTEKGPRKWHLTAYFTQTTVDQLGTVDDIPGVGELSIPENTFRSTRVGKNRNKGEDAASKQSSGPARTYAPFPSPLPDSPRERPPESPSVEMFQPYPNYNGYHSKDTPHQSQPPTDTRSSQPVIYPPSQSRATPTYSYAPPEMRSASIPSSRPKGSPSRMTDPSEVACSTPPYYLGPSGISSPQVYNHPVVYQPPNHPPPDPTPDVWYETQNSGTFHDQQPPVVYSSRPTSDVLSSPLYVAPPSYGPPLPPSASAPAPTYSTYSSPPSQQYESPAQYLQPTIAPFLPPLSIPEYGYPEDYGSPDSSSSDGRRGDVGPCRDLAPLHSLKRHHPYRRDPVDDKALRLLDPRPSPAP